MAKTFSERKGYKRAIDVIQTETMNDALRSSIWNTLLFFKWTLDSQFVSHMEKRVEEINKFGAILWVRYFKKPVDERPLTSAELIQDIRKYFFSCKWNEVYDFLEYILDYYKDEELNATINLILERELSGYRYIDGIFTNITNPEEVDMLQLALEDNDYPPVQAHLNRALDLLSDKEKPDYRNSIKESISAVESIAKIIAKKPKATLSDALKIIQEKCKIHPALFEAYNKLYGYTGDEDGIRHAMLDEPELTLSDAKYFLFSCISFINYLKSKM